MTRTTYTIECIQVSPGKGILCTMSFRGSSIPEAATQARAFADRVQHDHPHIQINFKLYRTTQEEICFPEGGYDDLLV